jgi:hypothetical protein
MNIYDIVLIYEYLWYITTGSQLASIVEILLKVALNTINLNLDSLAGLVV